MPLNKSSEVFIGIHEGHVDPAVAVVKCGKLIAYSEEERHIRLKHAKNIYPEEALKYCLSAANVKFEEVDAVAFNWNLPAYNDETMERFFENMKVKFDVDNLTTIWQKSELQKYNHSNFVKYHESHWRRMFGDIKFPQICSFPHHFVHAFQSCMQSPFNKSVCLTMDGSGDQYCTVLWRHKGKEIVPIKEIVMPHSLGWLYAAFTEYLGFKAYDGEYKVMGLAAYGKADSMLQRKLNQIIFSAPDNIEYRIDPTYIHYGPHTYSQRFTDKLVKLLGKKPRLPHEQITNWHQDLAFAVQDKLEVSVKRLISWAVKKTGFSNICISGGVGLNVKLNEKIFQLEEVDGIFVNPLCSDAGAAAGSAFAACYKFTGKSPKPLETLALGYEETNESIEKVLKQASLKYRETSDVCEETAEELVKGKIIGWFQGRMEAGPRALGQRSILCDPRFIKNRDKVNAIIKYREYWRPFCPSMTEEAAEKYFDKYTKAPFMVISFVANEKLKKDAPAIVHVDGTSRVQLVSKNSLPRFYELITAFGKRTGVPILLNTSFNIKGEPMVCTIQDALRTFWSTGLDVLVAGDFIVTKPGL